MKKILVCAVLAFAVRASGQSQEVRALGVVIESWRYDPAEKIVILHLVNNSGKDVTGFNISIAERYADGTTDYVEGRPNDIHGHQMMQDLLLPMINFQTGLARRGGMVTVRAGVVTAPKNGLEQQIMHQQLLQNLSGNGTFAAGTSRDFIDHVSKDVSDIEAVVDVVIYADHTARVLDNERGFKHMLADRKGQLLAMEKVTEVVKGVLADPTVTTPFDAAIQKLTPLVEAAEQKHGPPEDVESNAAMHFQMDVRALQPMQRSEVSVWSRMNMTERDWLEQYVENQQKRIELMKPHCELEVQE